MSTAHATSPEINPEFLHKLQQLLAHLAAAAELLAQLSEMQAPQAQPDHQESPPRRIRA